MKEHRQTRLGRRHNRSATSGPDALPGTRGRPYLLEKSDELVIADLAAKLALLSHPKENALDLAGQLGPRQVDT